MRDADVAVNLPFVRVQAHREHVRLRVRFNETVGQEKRGHQLPRSRKPAVEPVALQRILSLSRGKGAHARA